MGEGEDVEISGGQWPIHFKVQAWAADKTTGQVPAMIIPSIHFAPEEAEEFKAGGKFDKAYDAFREFAMRKNPKIKWIAEADAPK